MIKIQTHFLVYALFIGITMRCALALSQIFFAVSSYACTSFGVLTNTGLIIGKNRDYMYSKQVFEYINPLKQFESWYGNAYHHSFPFYALISKSDVKFGINEAGLTAIEEDPPFPSDAAAHRRYIQPYQGYSEGMVLYGLLQNFSSVAEIVPYLDQIFSVAAPNFYQIADAHTILNVEVAYGAHDEDSQRAYKYTIINRPGESFAHTNTFLSPEFEALNQLSTNTGSINGSNNRLNKIKQKMESAKGDFSHAFNWYLDTSSDVGNGQNKNYCQNTSIFRSYLQNITAVGADTDSDTEYGTVSSFMVEYKEDNAPLIHLRLLESINTVENSAQKIVYKEAQLSLDSLFMKAPIPYMMHTFIRPAPVNGVCGT